MSYNASKRNLTKYIFLTELHLKIYKIYQKLLM